jgi:hypothetical protein
MFLIIKILILRINSISLFLQISKGLPNFFNNIVRKKKVVEVSQPPVTIYADVILYLRMPLIPMQDLSGRDQDILLWRRYNSPNFIYLAKMARQFLAALASFACSDRLFSSARKMHDDFKRTPHRERWSLSSLFVTTIRRRNCKLVIYECNHFLLLLNMCRSIGCRMRRLPTFSFTTNKHI